MSDHALEEHLEVGLDVYLDLQPGVQNSPRYPGRIRGWESNKYILLALNPGSGAPIVRRGKQCVVRFMHEGEVWGFTALFGEPTTHTDLTLIHLYWPQQVARLQVRKHERVAIEIPCTVHLDDDNTADATIGDISGGGCSIITSSDLEVGKGVHLSFRMPGGGQVTRRPVLIRNRRIERAAKFSYGCQFQEEKEEDRSISLFVARKKAMDRGESAPHPQVLVLSRDDADVLIAQNALAGSPYEAVAAMGVLDLGFRLHTCKAVGILISFEQKELSAIEVIPLIQESRGMEEIPLFLYGGGEGLRSQAKSLGAALCLDGLGNAAEIIPFLPEVTTPVEEEEPQSDDTDSTETEGTSAGGAPASADADVEPLEANLDEYGSDDEGDDDDDEDEIDLS